MVFKLFYPPCALTGTALLSVAGQVKTLKLLKKDSRIKKSANKSA